MEVNLFVEFNQEKYNLNNTKSIHKILSFKKFPDTCKKATSKSFFERPHILNISGDS